MTDGSLRYVGVDLGGTKILALVVTDDGEVLARLKQQTDLAGDVSIANQIAAAIDGVVAEAGLEATDIAGIGVAIPGTVDSRTGYIITVPNLQIDDLRMVDTLRDRFGLPVALGNDVNLGTLAECWQGAARGADSAVGIFVGTGIGGGVVIDGRIRAGAEDMAGEIGHLCLMVDGPVCGCGNLGCFEALASRTAMERDIRAGIAAGRESTITHYEKAGRLKSGALASALDDGDELVTEVMTRAAHYLAMGVLTIRHLLNPELIIFGGGVIEACSDFLIPLIEQDVAADNMKGSRDALRIVISELADDAVALGAAGLVRAEVTGVPLGRPLDESDEEAPLAYPNIDSVDFGVVVVDGAEIARDIQIRADGKLRNRKKKRLRKLYGTSHVIDGKEIARVCKGNPDKLFIGQGFQGMIRLTDDAREYLEALAIACELLPSPDAAEAYNEAEGSKALILHVTC